MNPTIVFFQPLVPSHKKLPDIFSHARIVDRLVEDGYVERFSVVGDRRASLVRLTEAGRTEFARQAKAHEDWVNAYLADYSADEAQDLMAMLSRVTEHQEETAHAV